MFHYFVCDNPVGDEDSRIYVEVSKEKLAELAAENIPEKGNMLALVKIDNESNTGHTIMHFEIHKITKE
jgi:hypothetical protein